MIQELNVTFLSGGTGTPKLIDGFNCFEKIRMTVIANTGDDWNFYGLHVSPDVDAVLLLLSDHLDTSKYWGIKEDTFNLVSFLRKLNENVWFNLGDKDAGLCLLRTYLMNEGCSLTETTIKIAKRLGIAHMVLPMCNEPVECRFMTSRGDLHLEELWIKEKGRPEIQSHYLKGIEKATVTSEVEKALLEADIIVIGPSNPVSSIGPIISVPGMKKLIQKSKAKKVGVSPVIGNKAFSGPATSYMKACGIEPSPLGVARSYDGLIDVLLIHEKDGIFAEQINKTTRIDAVLTNIVLDTVTKKKELVKTITSIERE